MRKKKKNSQSVQPCPAFKQSIVNAIKAEAEKNHDAISVSHIFPRAYCVAKPASLCAILVVPPCDAEPQVSSTESLIIQNKTAADVEVGKWYSTAYCCGRNGCQERRVIFSL